MIASALKGITDNQTVTAYKKDCKRFKTSWMHRRFYKWTDGKIEVISMDYKQKIIALLDETQNDGKLAFIYKILVKYLRSEWTEV